MPTWDCILNEIKAEPSNFDKIRRTYIGRLSQYTKRNTIVYYSAWLQKTNLLNSGFRFDITDSDKMGFMSTIKGLDKSKGLDLILHTPGGSIAATESIVLYLQSIFGKDIRAIVPQIAMSAGTMIALSTKEIVLGKHSNLGPIDPQIDNLPTHGIIEEFESAKEDLKKEPSVFPVWEAILSHYHPTLIGECKKAIIWSEKMVREWLLDNMFFNDEDKEAKVEKIINELGSHALTLSHSRHLHLDYLKSLDLKILELESDEELQDLVLSIHHSCIISLTGTPAYKIIENQNGKAFIQIINQVK